MDCFYLWDCPECGGIWDCIKQLMNPETIINQGGIFLLTFVIFAETGILAGFFLPGDSLLFTAGLLCSIGIFKVNILTILICLILAAIIGDSVGYYIGKKMGTALFSKKESLLFKPEYVKITKDFYDKHGGQALIYGRFLPIIRTFAPVMAGVVQMEYKQFIRYNVFGGLLWVLTIVLSGYLLGSIFPWLKDYLEFIIIGLVIVTTIPVVNTVLKERKLAKQKKNSKEN